MNQPLKDFFYYNKNERNAILFLLFILIGIFISPPIYFAFSNTPQIIASQQTQKDFAAFQNNLQQLKNDRKNRYYHKKNKNYSSPKNIKLAPFLFDPNTVSSTALKKMKLPSRTIKSIINYRNKGGKFKYKASLEKIYTLSAAHFEQLLPFIDLPNQTEKFAKEEKEATTIRPMAFDPNTANTATFEAIGLAEKTIISIMRYREKGGQFRKKEDFKKIYTLPEKIYLQLVDSIFIKKIPLKKAYQFTPKKYYKIDINTANLDDFKQFRGIGASYSKRILKFREALGGFRSTQQMADIYGLPDSVLSLMQPYLLCKNHPLFQININTASLEELKAHPYLRWFHAKEIIKHRETYGKFKSVELLQILESFDDNKGTYEKVKYYLTI